MRNLFFIIFILIGSLLSAQQLQHDNVFSEEEQKESTSDQPTGGPGTTNPGGDFEDDDVELPIDGYIPLLLITAFGIIIYKTRKNQDLRF
ncbi:hypothetical protein [Kaistella antarctica]|uniref:Signal peptidase n=1 Tax=Kaistella antarctica TaxID=266748 RepID=A0A3S4V2L3_9FLAO|nr:hypothetical protein [Kaistella antarctica]KEY18800.1 hypothetical protein HY04_10025 [Kaistella antarctica]SEW15275.1 hypothetical protein SAMN05421765_2730 [Kaistella antarctica]VEH99481.1 Uncharacterised protein [Kaistella antarctica]